MGWTIPCNRPHREDLIADRIRERTWTRDDGTVVRDVALKHCFAGGIRSGTLWIVWERTATKPPLPAEQERWIGCDLLEYYPQHGSWGYKDIEACMGPVEVTCPPVYLKLVPPHLTAPKCYCHKWRDRVLEYWKQRAERQREKAAMRR